MSVHKTKTPLGALYAAECDTCHRIVAVAYVSKQWASDVLLTHGAVMHGKKIPKV